MPNYATVPRDVVDALCMPGAYQSTVHFGRHNTPMPSAEALMEIMELLRAILYSKVYAAERVLAEEPKVEHVLKTLFEALITNPGKTGLENVETDPVLRALDFLSGMTDRYALQFFDDIAKPSPWPIA